MITAWQEAMPRPIAAARSAKRGRHFNNKKSPTIEPRPKAVDDHRPGRRAIQLVLHQHRPEHEDRRQHDDVVDDHRQQERPHPRAGADLAPAALEVGEERLRHLRALHGARTQRQQAHDRHQEGARVHDQRRPLPRQRDQETAEHRPDDRAGRHRHRAQRVGRLKMMGLVDRLRHQAAHRRREERVGRAEERRSAPRGARPRRGRRRAGCRRSAASPAARGRRAP